MRYINTLTFTFYFKVNYQVVTLHAMSWVPFHHTVYSDAVCQPIPVKLLSLYRIVQATDRVNADHTVNLLGSVSTTEGLTYLTYL